MSRSPSNSTRAASPPDAADLPADPRDLPLVLYPDPRLRKRAAEAPQFDAPTSAALGRLAARMLEVMRQCRGVGLAAPQLGVAVRMFVMNATGNPEDDRVYVNPRLSDPEGEEERDEGCLSLPEINTPVWRSLKLRLRARDVQGNAIDETAEGFIARIWQHETDHLDGVLILDKMSATMKMSNRKKLKELEDAWLVAHPRIDAPKKKRRFGRRK